MSSMTLGQASDALRGLAEIIREHGTCAPMAVEHVADAIDAHLAGMGEPVAQGDASLGRYKACGRATRAVCDGLDGNGLGCTNAPPINLAAVREVIESHINEAKNLRHDPESQDYLYEQADKLEAALPESKP